MSVIDRIRVLLAEMSDAELFDFLANMQRITDSKTFNLMTSDDPLLADGSLLNSQLGTLYDLENLGLVSSKFTPFKEGLVRLFELTDLGKRVYRKR